jgi:hypothetical protein
MYSVMLGPIGPAKADDFPLRFALEECRSGGPDLAGLQEIADNIVAGLLDYANGADDYRETCRFFEACLQSKEVFYDSDDCLEDLRPEDIRGYADTAELDELEEGGRAWVWQYVIDAWPDAWRP